MDAKRPLITPEPPSTRRALLAGLGVALLAGCASRAPVRTATRGIPVPASAVGARAGSLRLDPAGRELAVAQAMLLVNTPYTYGGNTPQGGFDCSGLVQYVFDHVAGDGVRLPRTTAQWAAAATPVSNAQLTRGDLVFFNTTGQRYSHMGIFIGDEAFVHAPSSGGTVRRTSLANVYFAPRYVGARRVFAA